jgi:hypothetical protein
VPCPIVTGGLVLAVWVRSDMVQTIPATTVAMTAAIAQPILVFSLSQKY